MRLGEPELTSMINTSFTDSPLGEALNNSQLGLQDAQPTLHPPCVLENQPERNNCYSLLLLQLQSIRQQRDTTLRSNRSLGRPIDNARQNRPSVTD